MKKIEYFLMLFFSSILMVACGYDNYDGPESLLEGKITYEGRAIGLKGSLLGGSGVEIQLYQDGYANRNPITVYANQEGTFSAVLFDGQYKLVTKDKNGPWVNDRDTLEIEVKGKTQCELRVTPYFMISNEEIEITDNIITGNCNIEKIVETANISQAMLLISQTSFVDENTNIARQNLNNIQPGETNFSLDIANNKKVQSAKALFARIGVKAKGADQAIYSKVFRLK